MSDEIQFESAIQEALEGAIIPDATEVLPEVIRVALMIPMDDPNEPDCRMGGPLASWGPPGGGKSERTEQEATKLGLEYRPIFPSTKMPEDFGDVPIVMGVKDPETGEVIQQLLTACLLTQVNELNRIGEGVLHYDEASLAPPATQGAMLPALLNRVVGSTIIAPGIRPLLSGNPPKFAAGGHALSAPFANRMYHVYCQRPSKESFIKYLVSMGSKRRITVQSEMVKLQKGWPGEWAAARGELAGFVGSPACDMDDYAIDPDPEDPQTSYCWPSPRTWIMAIRAKATCKCLGVRDEIAHLFIEAAVSRGPAIKFIDYLVKADLPDALDVLEKGWKVDTNRLDRSIAVATSITTKVTGTPDKTEQNRLAVLCWKRYDDYIDANLSDVIMQHADVMLDASLGPSAKDPKVKKAAADVIYKLGKDPVSRFA